MADFEKASREKVRFATVQGQLSVEDLWTLPLTSARSANLNDIAKALNKELKESGEEDFVNDVKKPSVIASLKFDIVKRVIEVKVKERDEAATSAKRKAEKQRILELIEKKQGAALEAKSEDELKALLAGLGD